MSADRQLLLDVRRELGDFTLAVQATVALDGITGLFGPSGSGKSSLLRTIAGFDDNVSGRVALGDQTWFDSSGGQNLPAHRRPVGYVFQDARLFTHLDVAGNLQFAASRAVAGSEGPGMDDVVRAFDLQRLMNRDVSTLSGGETQRVAIARTLLCKPSLLLLDEPLAALDIGRKSDILPYIESLRERFGIPVIYVSHAVDEVARLADRVLVLEHGRVAAEGETVSVLNSLQLPGARFERPAIIEATVVRQLPDLHLTELDFNGQTLFVPAQSQRRPRDAVRLQVRPGDVALALSRPEGLSFRNILEGRLHDVQQPTDSAFATAVIDVGGSHLRCQLTCQAVIELELAAGMPVYALVKTASFDERAPDAN